MITWEVYGIFGGKQGMQGSLAGHAQADASTRQTAEVYW